jgi:UDP-2-acetamido-3-amino-2,3-dideoxy-glucuronate N-acetyltransferase
MTFDRQAGAGPAQIDLQSIPSPAEGNIGVVEFDRHVPFIIRRIFYFYDVPSTTVRGGHAHRAQQQFMICLAGQVTVMTEHASIKAEHILDRPLTGLYLPPITWVELRFDEEDSIATVLTCSAYDEADYIRDYKEFLAAQ